MGRTVRRWGKLLIVRRTDQLTRWQHGHLGRPSVARAVILSEAKEGVLPSRCSGRLSPLRYAQGDTSIPSNLHQPLFGEPPPGGRGGQTAARRLAVAHVHISPDLAHRVD